MRSPDALPTNAVRMKKWRAVGSTNSWLLTMLRPARNNTPRVGRVYHRDGEPIEAPVGEAQLRAALHAAPLAGPDREDASEAAGLPRDAGPA